MKRYKWKTFRVSERDWHTIKGFWSSSSRSFPKGKTLNFDSFCEIETDLSIAAIRDIRKYTGVKINMSQIIFDTMSAAEREEMYRAEDENKY